MSTFTLPLIVSPLPDGTRWRLVEDFEYHVGSEKSLRYVYVHEGFETDFASVPRLFWFLPDWATYNKSSVLHDALYHSKRIRGEDITRREADHIFLEAMLVEFRHHKFGKIVAYLEFFAVRLFGGLAWKYKKQE